jgi:ribose transport system permease protein
MIRPAGPRRAVPAVPVLAYVGRVQRRAPVLQVTALVLLYAYGAVTIDGFTASASLKSMLILAALLGLASVGQTLVVILGGLDLSVSGYIVAGAIMISQLCGVDHWPTVAAIALIILLAAILGGVTGWLCQSNHIQPLIPTLGMSAVASGGVLAWTHGQVTGSAPAFLTQFTSVTGRLLGIGIPPVVIIWGLVAVVLSVVLHRTIAGRCLYASGANPRAAGLALIDQRRVWIVTFAVSAIFSVIAGMLLAGFSGADPSIGDPYLFQGLTAVIVGGTTIMGARGDYSHTVAGALILTVLSTILVGRGLDPADQEIIFGALILIVVAGYGRERRLGDQV